MGHRYRIFAARTSAEALFGRIARFFGGADARQPITALAAMVVIVK
jgi:hypothetical protein